MAAGLGARPIEWLLANAGLDARWCVIHATHMTRERTPRPRSERRGGGPLPPDRGEPRRRSLSARRLPPRRRAPGDRHRRESPDRPARRVAHARVRPACHRTPPRRVARRGGDERRRGAVRARRGRRCASTGAADGRDQAGPALRPGRARPRPPRLDRADPGDHPRRLDLLDGFRRRGAHGDRRGRDRDSRWPSSPRARGPHPRRGRDGPATPGDRPPA